jgi:tetratricopeptide (TPR) repeat protein
MKLSARISTSAALLLVLASTVGCTKLRARDQLVKGVSAFKMGQYEQAVSHFQQSVALDPDYDSAHLYLATAYAQQVVPNLDTPDNIKVANLALDGFNFVLSKKPNDLGALQQIASIHRNIKQFDLAKADEIKILSIKPDDANANYTIGVIDWQAADKNSTTVLAADGMQVDKPGQKIPPPVCSKLQSMNSADLDEALKYLQAAVNINPNFDDAMQYLNLVYRRKAEIECGNDAAAKADLEQADMWVQKSMGARKANELAKEKKAGGGIDVSK